MSKQKARAAIIQARLNTLMRRIPIFIVLASLASLGQACSNSRNSLSDGPPPGTYELDPVLLVLYDHIGGVDRAGYAISPPSKAGTATTQFVEAGKLTYKLIRSSCQQI